ncbi:uncharacterized protein V2V93DRAFT_333063 [Kockiozyma suomiensis]|uniref:uncharacterized protein n=1 Tax=Kockiozyma suomiensis TaxID=1337062 RepID=UPI003343A452
MLPETVQVLVEDNSADEPSQASPVAMRALRALGEAVIDPAVDASALRSCPGCLIAKPEYEFTLDNDIKVYKTCCRCRLSKRGRVADLPDWIPRITRPRFDGVQSYSDSESLCKSISSDLQSDKFDTKLFDFSYFLTSDFMFSNGIPMNELRRSENSEAVNQKLVLLIYKTANIVFTRHSKTRSAKGLVRYRYTCTQKDDSGNRNSQRQEKKVHRAMRELYPCDGSLVIAELEDGSVRLTLKHRFIHAPAESSRIMRKFATMVD